MKKNVTIIAFTTLGGVTVFTSVADIQCTLIKTALDIIFLNIKGVFRKLSFSLFGENSISQYSHIGQLLSSHKI